jgi:superfamily II DNA or RNA helicase
MYLQQVGRCLRPKADGSAAIILDHVGNVERHGLPTEERNWTLEGRDKRKRDAAPSVRMCPRCFAANGTAAQVCSECGHEFTTEARELPETAGELVEITAELRRKRAEVGGARSMEDLVALGRKRGYKNPAAWANHVLNGRAVKVGNRL